MKKKNPKKNLVAVKNLGYTRENAWEKLKTGEDKKVFGFAEGYRRFISEVKTEREFVTQAVAKAEKHGFRDLDKLSSIKPGDRVYRQCQKKTLLLATIGKEPFEKGLQIIGGHIDSPRLDIKPNPLYEEAGMALLDTHYYGGIKKYQWVTIPLALHGVIAKKDGTIVEVCVGEDPKDPVLYISDLLIHLSRSQMKESLATGVTGENLNVLVGSRPLETGKSKGIKEKIKFNILRILNDRYGVSESDFLSAELEIVPAGEARDCGLDSSMIAGYGHDDRICSYPAMESLFEIKKPQRTCMTILTDKEEIGSYGATGMDSYFFENTIREISHRLAGKDGLTAQRALENSAMLSSDVCNAHDPNYPGVDEKKNAAHLGSGVVLVKFTGHGGKSGANDANAEFLGSLRRILDKDGVIWQPGGLGKVDEGGGGTIAFILARYGMQVVDIGVPLLSMHAPIEIASKVDLFMAYRAYKAFFRDC